jgi:hypothetical protein
VVSPLGELGATFHGGMSRRSEDWTSSTGHAALREASTLLPMVLESLLERTELLAAVAQRSYIHANGFAKIVLARSDNGQEQLRLHIWPESSTPDPGDTHDHRWSFVSLPLLGTFSEGRFTETTTGDDRCVYQCDSRQGREWLTLRGPMEVKLEQVSAAERQPGESYSCRWGEIHNFGPSSSGVAATLVLVGEPQRAFANVYREDSLTPDELTVPSPSMSSQELANTISLFQRYA